MGSSSSSVAVGCLDTLVDAAQELGDILYDNEVIGPFLHPEFERRGPQFSVVLTKFLRQYSLDIGKDASSQMEKEAYRLVRFRAPLIAQTVQSRPRYPLQSLFDDRRKRLEQLEVELAKLEDIKSNR